MLEEISVSAMQEAQFFLGICIRLSRQIKETIIEIIMLISVGRTTRKTMYVPGITGLVFEFTKTKNIASSVIKTTAVKNQHTRKILRCQASYKSAL